MALVSKSISNLINGVSQQPYAMRMASQGEMQLNAFSSVVEGLKKRPATTHVTKLTQNSLYNATVHHINRDVDERYIVVLTNGAIYVYDLDGTGHAVSYMENTAGYMNVSDASNFRVVTVADYTFIVNTEKTVAMKTPGPPGTTGYDNTALSPSRGKEAIVFIKQADYSTDYTVTLNGVTVTASIGDDPPCKTTTVAESLQSQLQEQLPEFTISVKHSTLWIRRNDSADFHVSVSDSRSNTHTSMAKDRVQQFSDLPTIAPSGFTVEVVGDQSSNFDNYWVKFVPNNDSIAFDEGVWKETVAPGIPWKLDKDTMPHALVRQPDGTFSFQTVNWENREVGDEESAPEPSFVGRKINDIFFHSNRLGVLSDENCVLSAASDFFNFFPSTVTTIVDSDPIDVAASHTSVSVLRHAVPFNKSLFLFSDQTQFILEGEDNLLSPTNATVHNVTTFEASTKVKPVNAGRTIYFATDKGVYSGVREYYTIDDTDTQDAADITGHIPRYIPSTIKTLAVTPNNNMLIALSDGERRSVFVYQYYWSGTNKLQSAWSKWRFSGDVISAEFIDTRLYLVVQYSDGVYLEYLDVEAGHTDSGESFEYRLDRKIKESACTVTYDVNTKNTTFTIPYYASSGLTPLPGYTVPASSLSLVTRTGSSKGVGVVPTIVSNEGRTLVVRGDWRNVPFYIGINYTMRYRFSTQVMKEQLANGSEVVVGSGRLQMRYWTIFFSATGYFRAEITPDCRNTQTNIYTGRVLGSTDNVLGEVPIADGKVRFPVMAKNDQVSIDLVNDNFFPCAFLSAEWEAFYTSRSSRL